MCFLCLCPILAWAGEDIWNCVSVHYSLNLCIMESFQELSHATHLLPKLVKKWRLNCLVLKLYPANEGYSLMLRGKTGIESETVKLPYEVSLHILLL